MASKTEASLSNPGNLLKSLRTVKEKSSALTCSADLIFERPTVAASITGAYSTRGGLFDSSPMNFLMSGSRSYLKRSVMMTSPITLTLGGKLS